MLVLVALTHLVLLSSGTLPLQQVKHEPSCLKISSGSEHEFKHLLLSSEANEPLGHGIHSVLSRLKIWYLLQLGTPPTLIDGLGWMIQVVLVGSGRDPAGHHSHCGQRRSDLKI